MTISLSQQSGTTKKLDDLTEKAIHRTVYSGCSCMVPGECRYCTANVDALRQRIRTLVEEARAEGVRGGTREQGAAP